MQSTLYLSLTILTLFFLGWCHHNFFLQMDESWIYRPLSDAEQSEKINPKAPSKTDLNPVEQAIFALLRDTIDYFHLKTELRVAGGIFPFFLHASIPLFIFRLGTG